MADPTMWVIVLGTSFAALCLFGGVVLCVYWRAERLLALKLGRQPTDDEVASAIFGEPPSKEKQAGNLVSNGYAYSALALFCLAGGATGYFADLPWLFAYAATFAVIFGWRSVLCLRRFARMTALAPTP